MGEHSSDRDDTPAQKTTGFLGRLFRPESLLTIALTTIVTIGAVTGTLHDGWHWTCVNLFHRCAPPPPPPPHYAIEDYLTKDPNHPPAKASTNYDLVGITYGTSVTTIAAMFPPEPQTRHMRTPGDSQQPNDPPTHYEAWEWQGIEVEVLVDDQSGTTTEPRVLRDPHSPWYVSAPNGALLGHTTAQQLIAHLDPDGAQHSGLDASLDEGVPGLALAEEVGGEGLDFITYTFEADDHVLDYDHPYPAGSTICQSPANGMRFETLDPAPDTYTKHGDCAPPQ